MSLSLDIKNEFIINALEKGWSVKKINEKSYEFSMDIKPISQKIDQNQNQNQNKTKIRSKSSPITNKELVQYIFSI